MDVVTIQAAKAAITSKSGRESLNVVNAAALKTWRSILANRDNALARVYVWGDSRSEGQGATGRANRWVDRLQEELRSLYRVAGNPNGGVGYLPAFYAQTSWAGAAVLAGAPTQEAAKYGPGKRSVSLTGAQTVTYSNITGTSIDVMWVALSTGGTLGVSIDGGAVTNINTLAGGADTDGQLTRVTLGNTGTAHTVVISAVAGTSQFDGIIVYDGDEAAGIQVIDGSHFGTSASTSTLWTNFTQNVLQSLAPGLVVIAHGTNDSTSRTSAQFKTDMQTIISLVTGHTTGPASVLLVMHTSRNATLIEPWANYVNAAIALASTNSGVAVLDLSRRMNPIATDNLSCYADAAHENNRGHAMVADFVVGAIARDSISGGPRPRPKPAVFTSSGSYVVPATGLYRVTAVGAGGGGAGAGSALTSGGTATQVGGGGGGAGVTSEQVVTLTAGTVLTVTIGARGAAGTGGAANSNAGTAGSTGGSTTVTGTGVSVTALGGHGGAQSAANSTTAVGGGTWGPNGTSTSTAMVGQGGAANSTTGLIGGAPFGRNGGGASGGGAATGTNGGAAGNAGTLLTGGQNVGAGGSGTTAGVDATDAAATDYGSGGAGGGGGAPGGKGGNGGKGAPGYAEIQPL